MKSILDCRACPLSLLLPNGCLPVIPNGSRKAEIMVINSRTSMDAHFIEKPLGTKHEILFTKIVFDANMAKVPLYITNMIKCFSGSSNTKTFNSNNSACIKEHLEFEIKLLNPKVITIFGVNSARALVNDKSISVGDICKYNNVDVLVTYSMTELDMRGKESYNHAVETMKTAYAKINVDRKTS